MAVLPMQVSLAVGAHFSLWVLVHQVGDAAHLEKVWAFELSNSFGMLTGIAAASVPSGFPVIWRWSKGTSNAISVTLICQENMA